jgi:hypothetical protein
MITKQRHGSPLFYQLLQNMADLHEKKSHDYASDGNPFGNYEFSGTLGSLFKHSPLDIGFVTRLGEKLFRLSNLEGSGKVPKNESIEDTELDLCVIMVLWMAARQNRRHNDRRETVREGYAVMPEDADAPEKGNDNVLSAIISLEPLMDKQQLSQTISYLQSCLRDLRAGDKTSPA